MWIKVELIKIEVIALKTNPILKPDRISDRIAIPDTVVSPMYFGILFFVYRKKDFTHSIFKNPMLISVLELWNYLKWLMLQ